MLWSQPKILSGQVSSLSIHVCEYLTNISSYDWGGTITLRKTTRKKYKELETSCYVLLNSHKIFDF